MIIKQKGCNPDIREYVSYRVPDWSISIDFSAEQSEFVAYVDSGGPVSRFVQVKTDDSD